jgi:hypothetical protein
MSIPKLSNESPLKVQRERENSPLVPQKGDDISSLPDVRKLIIWPNHFGINHY